MYMRVVKERKEGDATVICGTKVYRLKVFRLFELPC